MSHRYIFEFMVPRGVIVPNFVLFYSQSNDTVVIETLYGQKNCNTCTLRLWKPTQRSSWCSFCDDVNAR